MSGTPHDTRVTVAGARHLARFRAPRAHWPNEGVFCTWLDVRAQLLRLLEILDLPNGDTPARRAAVVRQAGRAVLTLESRTEHARRRDPGTPASEAPDDPSPRAVAGEHTFPIVIRPRVPEGPLALEAPPTPSRAELPGGAGASEGKQGWMFGIGWACGVVVGFVVGLVTGR